MLIEGANIYLLTAMGLAAIAPRERQRVAEGDTPSAPVKSKPKLKVVGGTEVPLGVPFDARLVLPRKAPMTARDSARQFAGWLRTYHAGKHSDRALMSLYAEFCEIEGVMQSAENMMRGELQKLTGVRRVVESVTKNGKRHRPVAWFIEGQKQAPLVKSRKGRKSA